MATSTEREASIWPAPGGVDYLDGLRQLLLIAQDEPTRSEWSESVIETFDRVDSPNSADGYLRYVLLPLGLADTSEEGRIRLTSKGERYLEKRGIRTIRTALLERIAGTLELLDILSADSPLRIGQIHETLLEQGWEWSSQWPVRYRLRWLQAVGLVDFRDYGRTTGRYPEYTLTTAGRQAVSRS